MSLSTLRHTRRLTIFAPNGHSAVFDLDEETAETADIKYAKSLFSNEAFNPFSDMLYPRTENELGELERDGPMSGGRLIPIQALGIVDNRGEEAKEFADDVLLDDAGWDLQIYVKTFGAIIPLFRGAVCYEITDWRRNISIRNRSNPLDLDLFFSCQLIDGNENIFMPRIPRHPSDFPQHLILGENYKDGVFESEDHRINKDECLYRIKGFPNMLCYIEESNGVAEFGHFSHRIWEDPDDDHKLRMAVIKEEDETLLTDLCLFCISDEALSAILIGYSKHEVCNHSTLDYEYEEGDHLKDFVINYESEDYNIYCVLFKILRNSSAAFKQNSLDLDFAHVIDDLVYYNFFSYTRFGILTAYRDCVLALGRVNHIFCDEAVFARILQRIRNENNDEGKQKKEHALLCAVFEKPADYGDTGDVISAGGLGDGSANSALDVSVDASSVHTGESDCDAERESDVRY